MADQIKIKIISPDRIFYEDDVDLIVLSTTEGEMGILYDHEPVTGIIDTTVVLIRKGEEEKRAAIHGGFIEVQPTSVTILADSTEWPDEIDVERAEESKKRAKQRLIDSSASDLNMTRANIALQKALNRIEASKYRK